MTVSLKTKSLVKVLSTLLKQLYKKSVEIWGMQSREKVKSRRRKQKKAQEIYTAPYNAINTNSESYSGSVVYYDSRLENK